VLLYAVLLLDRAGWHTTDKLRVSGSITLIWLPSFCDVRHSPAVFASS
jgi:hypothetical protein